MRDTRQISPQLAVKTQGIGGDQGKPERETNQRCTAQTSSSHEGKDRGPCEARKKRQMNTKGVAAARKPVAESHGDYACGNDHCKGCKQLVQPPTVILDGLGWPCPQRPDPTHHEPQKDGPEEKREGRAKHRHSQRMASTGIVGCIEVNQYGERKDYADTPNAKRKARRKEKADEGQEKKEGEHSSAVDCGIGDRNDLEEE